jgi:hypothetical protein
VPTFGYRRCRVVSTKDPHGRILGFLNRTSTIITNKKIWEDLIAYLPWIRYGPHRRQRVRTSNSTLNTEVTRYSETSVVTRSTRRHIAEDGIPQSHRRENLKFYPDDRGDTLLRNVGFHKIHRTPHRRRRHSSESPPWKPQILQGNGTRLSEPHYTQASRQLRVRKFIIILLVASTFLIPYLNYVSTQFRKLSDSPCIIRHKPSLFLHFALNKAHPTALDSGTDYTFN